MKTSILFKWPKCVSHACPHYIRWLRNIVVTFMNSIIITEFSNFIYESLFTISTFIAACQLPQASNVCLPVCPWVYACVRLRRPIDIFAEFSTQKFIFNSSTQNLVFSVNFCITLKIVFLFLGNYQNIPFSILSRLGKTYKFSHFLKSFVS